MEARCIEPRLIWRRYGEVKLVTHLFRFLPPLQRAERKFFDFFDFFHFFHFFFILLKGSGRMMLVSKFDEDRSNGSPDTALERRALNLYKAVSHGRARHSVTGRCGEWTPMSAPRHK